MTTNAILCLPAPPMLSVNIPFSGFYGSIWEHALDREHEQTCEYWQESDGRESFERQFPELAIWRDEMTNDNWSALFQALSDRTDYSSAFQAIAKDYSEAFATWMADALGRSYWTEEERPYTYEGAEPGSSYTHRTYHRGMAYEWEEMVSPREYNFTTDRLFAKFSLSDLETIRQRLDAAELAQEARERFTSRSGFISFYDPDVSTWPEALEDWDHNQLGTLVRAFVALELGERDNLDDELYEAVRPDEGGYWDNAVDWEALRRDAEDIADEIEAEVRRHDPDFNLADLPTPRCPYTLDLFANQEQRRA
jgi:hypothetical protein